MRSMVLLSGLATSALFLAGVAYVEPETDVAFPETLVASGKTLALTGAGVRQVYGFDIYAIGHYAEATVAPKADATAEEKLAHWMKSDSAKAMVIHFVFDADKGNMRSYATKSLSDAGYTGEKQEKFLEVFARDYTSGTEVRLVAVEPGVLKVQVNGKDEGVWQDADLVRALWQAWLGESSPVKKREALVTLPEEKKQ